MAYAVRSIAFNRSIAETPRIIGARSIERKVGDGFKIYIISWTCNDTSTSRGNWTGRNRKINVLAACCTTDISRKTTPVIALLELKESVKQPVTFVAKIIPGLAVPEKDPSNEAEVFDPSYTLKISTLF